MKNSWIRFSLQVVSLRLVAILACGIVAGCEKTPGPTGPKGDVTIKITSGGAPISDASIDLLNPDEGDGGGGQLSSEGTIKLEGVRCGKYSVVIRPPDPDPTPDQSVSAAEKEYANIPKKFRDAATSPLSIEIVEGANEVEFDLKDLE